MSITMQVAAMMKFRPVDPTQHAERLQITACKDMHHTSATTQSACIKPLQMCLTWFKEGYMPASFGS